MFCTLVVLSSLYISLNNWQNVPEKARFLKKIYRFMHKIIFSMLISRDILPFFELWRITLYVCQGHKESDLLFYLFSLDLQMVLLWTIVRKLEYRIIWRECIYLHLPSAWQETHKKNIKSVFSWRFSITLLFLYFAFLFWES